MPSGRSHGSSPLLRQAVRALVRLCAQADGGRDQLGGFQRLGQLRAGGADAINVRDGERGGIPILNVDGVAALGVDGVNEGHIDVGECDVIAAARQDRADKSAANVARPDHNCLFHIVPPVKSSQISCGFVSRYRPIA